MKKIIVAKTALCLGAAITILVSSNAPKISSTTLFTEVGLAGISLSLDNNYKTNLEELVNAEVDALKEVKEEKAPEVSKYENMGISIANDYVNVREKPDTESEIQGKLHKGSAATILTKEGEWVKIESGKVKGYIKAEFLAIGFSAEELVDDYGTKIATVNTTTLYVRDKKSVESSVLTMVPIEEEYEVLKEDGDWLQILVDEGDDGDSAKGFVSSEFVDVRVEFEKAISVEEEKAKIKAEEEARQAEEEAVANLAAQEARAAQPKTNTSSSKSTKTKSATTKSRTTKSTKTKKAATKSEAAAPSASTASTGSGSAIASFALKFVGNPYVYGGSSLTNGADCSGFVLSVFRNFGISLPRVSGSQASAGSSISVSSARAGDLIFYGSNGRVSHVAIAIGGGKVVHASNKKTGIKTSNLYYRTPICARRVIK